MTKEKHLERKLNIVTMVYVRYSLNPNLSCTVILSTKNHVQRHPEAKLIFCNSRYHDICASFLIQIGHALSKITFDDIPAAKPIF